MMGKWSGGVVECWSVGVLLTGRITPALQYSIIPVPTPPGFLLDAPLAHGKVFRYANRSARRAQENQPAPPGHHGSRSGPGALPLPKRTGGAHPRQWPRSLGGWPDHPTGEGIRLLLRR